MSHAIIEVGEKVHVMTRRLFPEDLRRHFAGVVQAVSELHIRAEGYVFVYNNGTNEYQRRKSKRVRILSLLDGNIVKILPGTVDIDALQYKIVDGRLAMTDGQYILEINEFGVNA